MTTAAHRVEVPIDRVEVSAYTVPTDRPESDGTLEWDRTTIVVVEISAGGATGLGYTYTDASAARLIEGRLRSVVEKTDAMAIGAAWDAMLTSVRNVGRPGLAAAAISAVDAALWDVKARLLDLSLVHLLGRVRDAVPVYGSGGFTSYSSNELVEQLEGWVAAGFAGEYGYDPWYFRRMLESGAVDVLQADATRCLGITGFLRAGALAEAHHVPLSAHTAPALHVHVCCALGIVRNLEWFHDHVRIERLLFDRVVGPVDGMLSPSSDRPGLGLELKRADAQRYEG